MDCERSLNLISARLDQEISAEDRAWLDAHLAECADCRTSAAAFVLQHEELRGEFAPRRAAVAETAAQVAEQLPAATTPPTAKPAPPTHAPMSRLMGILLILVPTVTTAALILFVLNPFHSRPPAGKSPVDPPIPKYLAPVAIANPEPPPLTPRSRPAAPPATALAVGASVTTPAGQRQRLTLPDHSVLYVDQNTALTLDSDNSLSVRSGSVYIESAPGAAVLLVTTPMRHVTAAGHFAVHALADATDVLVTLGTAHVHNVTTPWEGDVQAGQFLAAKATQPESAPRASYLLDWTRDLMAAAETPLVPSSRHAGGALLAVDANGQEAKLGLRNFTIDVHIEDGFARTTIDQTYFNQHPWRLEGTFFFPLPADASLSRLAMYVDGNLMEGGMAERDYARAVYQRIVNGQRDPALLEWVDGTTFKMRVFPLEGRQEKRIVLSYIQRLPTLYGRTTYRFPGGHSLQKIDKWRFRATVTDGQKLGLVFHSPSHPTTHSVPAFPAEPGLTEDKGDPNNLLLFDEARDVKADRDVVLELEDPASGVALAPRVVARFAVAEQDGAHYLMARYRPELPGQATRQRRDWVFLFEASADRDPLLARTQLDLVRHLLDNANSDDTFMVLTANSRVHSFQREPVPVTPDNIAAAVAFLERTHLVGALDLGSALDRAGEALKKGSNPHLVHLGSGLTAMGVRQPHLLEHLPKAPYIGIGVGKRWSRDWMKQAAEKTGGHFTQVNPDEPVGWRAFELMATLDTPRLLETVVEAEDGASVPFLLEATTVCQGEELCAVARLTGPMPKAIVVRGRVNGVDFRQVVPLTDVKENKGYLPRTWARLEIERLLANPQHKKEEVIALSKDMYVMTPYTSLLVLENEEMYAEYKVDRGRKDHWAMYDLQAKVPVKAPEYDPNMPADVRNAPKGLKPAASTVLETIRVRQVDGVLNLNPAIIGSGIEESLSKFDAVFQTTLQYTGTEALGLQRGGVDRFNNYSANIEEGRSIRPADATTMYFDEATRLQRKTVASINLGRRTGYEGAFPGRSGVVNINGVTNLGLDKDPVSPWVTERMVAEDDFKNADLKPMPVRGRFDIDGPISEEGRPKEFMKQAFTSNDGIPALLPAALENSPAPDEAGIEFPATGKFQLRYVPKGQTISRDDRLFSDLISYAPGLNTSAADRLAVLEAEAAPDLRHAPGTIDPAARALLEKARQGGWQRVSMAGSGILYFNGKGHYVYKRTSPLGLHEEVICDGTTLYHLYPELGLAARRSVSRFHRMGLLTAMPWLAPPAEDLARGADVKLVGERIIAIVPHRLTDEPVSDKNPPTYEIHLVFAEDGRLAERRLVEMPAQKVLSREIYDAPGTVRLCGPEDELYASSTTVLQPADAPNLVPATNGLVVLPMPLRSKAHVWEKIGLDPSNNLESTTNSWCRCLDRDAATELLMSTLAEHDGTTAQQIFHICFASHGDQRIGLYVILAACGVNVVEEPAFEYHLTGDTTPLARYLMLVTDHSDDWLQNQFPFNAGTRTTRPDGWLRTFLLQASVSMSQSDHFMMRTARQSLEQATPPGDFLHQLATLRDLNRRWTAPANPLTPLWRKADLRESLAYVLAHRHTAAGRSLLMAIQAHNQHSSAHWRMIADTWGILGRDGDYQARYEQACCLISAGDRAGARAHFLALYEDALASGFLPPVDHRFRWALEEEDVAKDAWTPLMRGTAARLVKANNRAAAVALANQVYLLNDRLLADNLLDIALGGEMKKEEKVMVYLAVIDYHMTTSQQPARAEPLLAELLATYPKAPALWRLATNLADKRGQRARSITCLEKALDLEYAHLPEVIALEQWRVDYGRLLTYYREQAQALHDAGKPAPDDLAVRTVRAVDRWRAHDPEIGSGLQTAAATLSMLGNQDLAWDYYTTEYAGANGADKSPHSLASTLEREGAIDLAERTYAVLCAADPTNGETVWYRAQNLRRAGRVADADALLRKLADDKAVSAALRDRVRWQLGERDGAKP